MSDVVVLVLGDHCFEFVRPGFPERARGGQSVVVAGEGWGSGSSREQAVWALQGAGVKAVIARSYAFIHKRNLVNEALPYLVVRDDAGDQAARPGLFGTEHPGFEQQFAQRTVHRRREQRIADHALRRMAADRVRSLGAFGLHLHG